MDPALEADPSFPKSGNGLSLFSMVSSSFLALGAIPLDKFLSAPSSGPDSLDLALHTQDIGPESGTPTSPVQSTQSSGPVKAEPDAARVPAANAVSQIFELCQRVFGTAAGAMKFEFVEDNGPDSLQCIFTVQRPEGSRRLFRSDPTFSLDRRNEAKAQAASIAIEMGVLDFIITGDHEGSLTKKGILAPLHQLDHLPIQTLENMVQEDSSIQLLEECCREWRAGLIMPHWVPLSEGKGTDKYGAALRIQLTPYCFRVFSTPIAYDTVGEAKNACANIALDEGILDFIKFGNGQTSPTVVDEDLPNNQTQNMPPTQAISLQDFYESLPQPFPQPELVIGKTASGINAPGWLNLAVQASRGTRLAARFIYTSDNSVGLNGCLLRLERPRECRSYLVEPMFSKRTDAKAAVCLLAISQGVASYIQSVTEEVQNKITTRMRRLATERLLPVLTAESLKIRPGNFPIFDFERIQGAFGCTLKLTFREPDGIREYMVPAEYATKADAKFAVTWKAIEEGAVEVLRFRGEPPPTGYVCFSTSLKEANLNPSWRRKAFGQPENSPEFKKFKSETGDAAFVANYSGNQVGFNGQSQWRSPVAPGSGHPGFSGNPAYNAGGPTGWNRAGPSNAGSFRGNAHFGHRGGPHSAGLRGGFGGGPGHHFQSASPHPQAPSGDPNLPFSGTPATNASAWYGNAPIGSPFGHGNGVVQIPAAGPGYNAPANFAHPATAPQLSGVYPGYGGGIPGAFPGAPTTQYQVPTAGAYGLAPVPPLSSPVHHGYPPWYTPPSPATAYPQGFAPLSSPQAAFLPPSGNFYPPPHHPTQKAAQQAASIAPGQTLSPANGSQSHLGDSAASRQLEGTVPLIKADLVAKASESNSPPDDPIPPDSEEEPQLIVSKLTAYQSGNYVAQLLAYCASEDVAEPEFHSEAVGSGDGRQRFKVWANMGGDKLELSGRYASLDEAKDRLAKQILAHARRSK